MLTLCFSKNNKWKPFIKACVVKENRKKQKGSHNIFATLLFLKCTSSFKLQWFIFCYHIQVGLLFEGSGRIGTPTNLLTCLLIYLLLFHRPSSLGAKLGLVSKGCGNTYTTMKRSLWSLQNTKVDYKNLRRPIKLSHSNVLVSWTPFTDRFFIVWLLRFAMRSLLRSVSPTQHSFPHSFTRFSIFTQNSMPFWQSLCSLYLFEYSF